MARPQLGIFIHTYICIASHVLSVHVILLLRLATFSFLRAASRVDSSDVGGAGETVWALFRVLHRRAPCRGGPTRLGIARAAPRKDKTIPLVQATTSPSCTRSVEHNPLQIPPASPLKCCPGMETSHSQIYPLN